MMTKQLCNDAIRLLESGESFVQATILKSSGSVPRGTGACMFIFRDGSILGTVGGGALEAGIMKAAPEIFETKRTRVIDMVLDGNDAVATGMICGGSATALIDYIDPENPGNLEFYSALRSTLQNGSQAWIVTAPISDGSHSQCLLLPDGTRLGTDGFNSDDNAEVYMHRIGTDGTVYIFGAGHCGEKLAHLLHTVGFLTVVIDDRAEFANTTRFPEADKILVPESMDIPFGDTVFNDDSYIVIVTRGHTQDELVLRGALRTGAGYIGMIGSRKKRDSIYARLLTDDYTQADIDRVTSPIGIPIEADTPEEIAVSIAAELIKVRANLRLSG